MEGSIQVLVEDFAKHESFKDFDILPASHLAIKEILSAVRTVQENAIQTLYTKIDESAVPELSSLTRHPYALLTTLLTVSVAHENIPVITQLLSITPSPQPDYRRFLNQPGRPFSAKITLACNAEVRSLVVKHGYQKVDCPGVPFDQELYDLLLARDQECLGDISQLLKCGVHPKMDHLRAAMKFKPIGVFELLLKYYPFEELNDCRLLHDAVEEGKVGRVRYLVDVVGIDIDMFPTERPEQETQFPDSYGARPVEPNGTPLHEAVRHRRKIIIGILLEKGAKNDIRDEDGKTPYEVAREMRASDIMALFSEDAGHESTTFSKALSDLFNIPGRHKY